VENADAVVIGGGMAGASVAWALAEHQDVILLEREPQPGQHATGRSAAVLSETSGTPLICALAAASRPFLERPPDGFADHPLVGARGLLWVGAPGDEAALDAVAARGRIVGAAVERLDAAGVRRHFPVLRPSTASVGGAYEPGALSLDVELVLQSYLRGLRQRVGRVRTATTAASGASTDAGWIVHTTDDDIACSVVVNAAGAWADEVAVAFGVKPLGLLPLRRTACIVPAGEEVRDWPLVMDVAGRFYCEPEPGGLLVSPADETPSEPCDARPDELDVALGLHRLAEATTFEPRHVRRAWAGLRTFTADRSPVAGEDPQHPGFFWLAGQGGAGIKTAPALASVVAALVARRALAPELAALDITAAALSPARLR
jgi:D-arginine dehydrogenase